jgi:hypothetical protein
VVLDAGSSWINCVKIKIWFLRWCGIHSLQLGAGTIKPEIISSLIMPGSDGGGGQTSDSMMSSVERKMHVRSGGSTREDLS